MAQVNIEYVSLCGNHILNADILGVQGHVQDSKAVPSEIIGHTTVHKRLHQSLVFFNLTSNGSCAAFERPEHLKIGLLKAVYYVLCLVHNGVERGKRAPWMFAGRGLRYGVQLTVEIDWQPQHLHG